MSPDSKSENDANQKGTITVVPKPKGMAKLALNAFLVLVAVIVLQVFFHLINNSINGYLSYFTARNMLILVGYAVLFAFMYNKFSAIWSHDSKRVRISLFNYNPSVARPFIERFIDAIVYTLFTAAIIWCGIELIDAAGFTDTDGDGVKDSAEFWFVMILIVAAVAQESGGQTESGGQEEGGDDKDDKGATGQTGTGTGTATGG